MVSRHSKALLWLGLLCAGAGSCSAQTLRDELEDSGVGARWKYNDWESAHAAATASKKPILALFR